MSLAPYHEASKHPLKCGPYLKNRPTLAMYPYRDSASGYGTSDPSKYAHAWNNFAAVHPDIKLRWNTPSPSSDKGFCFDKRKTNSSLFQEPWSTL